MCHSVIMNPATKAWAISLSLAFVAPWMQAQVQSTSPVDKTVSQNISKALAAAGIDPRVTSVQVITTSDHVVYLTGLISDKNMIKVAGDVAAKTAPSYRIVNNISSSFWDQPSHVSGSVTK